MLACLQRHRCNRRPEQSTRSSGIAVSLPRLGGWGRSEAKPPAAGQQPRQTRKSARNADFGERTGDSGHPYDASQISHRFPNPECPCNMRISHLTRVPGARDHREANPLHFAGSEIRHFLLCELYISPER
jgi:hypothetical protein